MKVRRHLKWATIFAAISTAALIAIGPAEAVTTSGAFVASRGTAVGGPIGFMGSFGTAMITLNDGAALTAAVPPGSVSPSAATPIAFIALTTPMGVDFGMGPLPGYSFTADPLLLSGSFTFSVPSMIGPGTLTATISYAGTGGYAPPGAAIGTYVDVTPTASLFGFAALSRAVVVTAGTITSTTIPGGGALMPGSGGGAFIGASGGFTLSG